MCQVDIVVLSYVAFYHVAFYCVVLICVVFRCVHSVVFYHVVFYHVVFSVMCCVSTESLTLLGIFLQEVCSMGAAVLLSTRTLIKSY